MSEFKAWMKNQTKYEKLTDGSWDYDVAVDYLYSFWTLSEIPTDHPKYEQLKEVGI